jgi:hypothetical protein
MASPAEGITGGLPDDKTTTRRSGHAVAMRTTAAEQLLVNFFYAHPVGHAVEALHYCLGYHAADPEREIAVALNAATATRLADFCPFVSSVYAIAHPFGMGCTDSRSRLANVPRRWDWVVDDARRGQAFQLRQFRGMGDYYAASDEHLIATRGRTVAGARPPAYLPHQQLRLELPDAARAAARARMVDGEGVPWIAIMPAGSGERALYPSLASWCSLLDALHEAMPTTRLALVGKLFGNHRLSLTTLDTDEAAALLAHPAKPLDCFDDDLAEQLAIVEASDVFLSPHTGFGFAALAVATPWLTISGGRWFEWFFNRVPFRSIIPDTERYPCFTQFAPLPIVDDGDDGPRTPSMSRARILDDLDAIVDAAIELIAGGVIYEEALKEYFQALRRAHPGDASTIVAIDDVHADYVGM